jgi:two-component system phosphate regulon sensor histidine kinase PhoR
MNKTDPKRFAFKIAVITAFTCAFFLYLFSFFYHSEIPVYFPPLISISMFIVTWTVVHLLFQKDYFEKIKLIYKNVLQLQKDHPEIKVTNDTDYVEEINRILRENEREQKEEIDHLKHMELYRKEFLGNVSHELKTPIFNVQGYIHTLLDGGIEDQDINLLYLNKAARSIDRLISIVDDLESISKIESGNLILELRTFDICDLTKEVIESSEFIRKEKHILLHIKESCDKPFYVYADKERIRQVLVNLLVNSIKYGKTDGFTEIRFYDFDDYITIEVEDNGIGIEKHDLPRLFERFYRVDKSRSRHQGGTGLGLAIVKHIIEAHGQKITVVSEHGYGTTFYFNLKKSK